MMIKMFENVPEINILAGERVGHTSDSGTSETTVRLQQLNEKAAHEALELAGRIKQEAASEAARLLKDVNRQAREIINNARRRIETGAQDEKSQINVRGSNGNLLCEVVIKIHDASRPTLTFNVDKELPIEESAAVENPVIEASSAAYMPPTSEPETGKSVNELHSELNDIIGSLETSELPPLTQERTGETGFAVKGKTEAVLVHGIATDSSELFFGEILLDIAPPVNVRSLLDLLRRLENTRGTRILGTAGSLTSGSKITLSLDKPLPLVYLLREMPEVDGIKIEEQTISTSSAERSAVRKLSVTLRNGGDLQQGIKAAF